MLSHGAPSLPSTSKKLVPRPRLNLPKIHRLVLRNFSLYSTQPTVEVVLNKGVFCLAGANGLGKSTFLAAVNFALTGRVSDPNRAFLSIGEFYRHTEDFSTEFFDGRIDENDREYAEVILEMTVGSQSYRLTRGMFEPEELRGLEITGEDGASLARINDLKPRERHDVYSKNLAIDIGLHSFEQYVFLQHFVFTFDESRHLLFWDAKVLERALYIAFGVDQRDAERADELRRESEKADSLARNANWQATELRKKLEDLQKAIGGKSATDDSEDLRAEHERLFKRSDDLQQKTESMEYALKDANLKISELSARQASLRAEYEMEFSRRFQTQSAVEQSPIVAMSLAENRCGVCGAEGLSVGSTIQRKLDNHRCPMCEELVTPATKKDIKAIQALDQHISNTHALLVDAVKQKDRLQRELAEVQARRGTARALLVEFEAKNRQSLDAVSRPKQVDGIDATIKRYRTQIEELLDKKKAQYDKRNDRRRELTVLQRGLINRYAAAEVEFVPAFIDLAQRFIGLDLDIKLETPQNLGVALLLEVKSSARRQFHQLSESQRFFIDIALRMALIKYMSSLESKGSFFVDTPEGSLDIAYESRAGDMFARFVRDGFGIIMTANINTSRLLLALAAKCGQAEMNLCRMTSWTELSDVQQGEEHLFDEAFDEIEKAMVGPKILARSEKKIEARSKIGARSRND
ncbi:AAA family ATPase [Paludibaculum fermentans]|uniref:AAA family ATPase n=1 Tax=Paludibaculum fermentans TaxID=1473598 RepID=UPI003EBBEB65